RHCILTEADFGRNVRESCMTLCMRKNLRCVVSLHHIQSNTRDPRPLAPAQEQCNEARHILGQCSKKRQRVLSIVNITQHQSHSSPERLTANWKKQGITYGVQQLPLICWINPDKPA
ncbi:unnamed protein product, partial [Ectocarpus sp. 8 AP-2014]